MSSGPFRNGIRGPSADDVGGFGVADPESEFAQRLGERSAVLDCLLNEQVGVLRRVRVPLQDRAGLAEEEVLDLMPDERIAEPFQIAETRAC